MPPTWGQNLLYLIGVVHRTRRDRVGHLVARNVNMGAHVQDAYRTATPFGLHTHP